MLEEKTHAETQRQQRGEGRRDGITELAKFSCGGISVRYFGIEANSAVSIRLSSLSSAVSVSLREIFFLFCFRWLNSCKKEQPGRTSRAGLPSPLEMNVMYRVLVCPMFIGPFRNTLWVTFGD